MGHPSFAMHFELFFWLHRLSLFILCSFGFDLLIARESSKENLSSIACRDKKMMRGAMKVTFVLLLQKLFAFRPFHTCLDN
mgnify:CR=1 FL=1